MRCRKLVVGSLALSILSALPGCHTCCKKRCDGPGDRLPPPGAAIGSPAVIPPAGIPPRASYFEPQPEILLPENRGYSPGAAIQPAPARPDSQSRRPANNDSLHLGIADFTVIKEGVWTGLRPDLAGLDWLRDKGTKLAVFLKAPGEDDTTDRQQFEKRGIAFESYEVAPETLNDDLYRRFVLAVKSPGPVFVYDREGAVKGYLWYAFLRVNELASEEAARIRAARVGYAVDGVAPRRELAAAAQRIVDKVK